MPLAVMWELTIPWYRDRLQPDYQRRTVAEHQALLTEAGLISEFWSLT